MSKVLVNINRLGGLPLDADIDMILAIINGNNGNLESDDKSDMNRHYAEQVVRSFRISKDLITREMLERYIKMSSIYIPFTLAQPEIIEQRIVAPLESAKRLACIGDYLASISLSGLVGEMLTVLLWEMNFNTIKDKKYGTVTDKKLFNNRFDRLQQSLRINIIEAFGYIGVDSANTLRKLQDERNEILHRWTDSYTMENIENIAIDCYNYAATLMKKILAIDLADPSSLKIDKRILDYISSFSKD